MKINRDGSMILSQGELSEINAILERPIKHQGGFQNRLLQLSDLFGVEHPEAPRAAMNGAAGPRSTAADNGRQASIVSELARPSTLRTADHETLRAVAERIKVLREAGLHAEATALFKVHFGALPPVQGEETAKRTADVETDDQASEPAIRAKRRASMGRTLRANAAKATADKRGAAMQARWTAYRKGKGPHPINGTWIKGVSAAVKRAYAKGK